MKGKKDKIKSSEELGLEEVYARLWTKGHSGGFTWSYNVYEAMDAAQKEATDSAYTNFAKRILGNKVQ